MDKKILCNAVSLIAIPLSLSAQAVVLDYEAVPGGDVYSSVSEQGFVTAVKRCDFFATIEACVKAGPKTNSLQYNANLGDDKQPNYLSINWSTSVKATIVVSPEDPNAVFTLSGASLATVYRNESGGNVLVTGYDENLNKMSEVFIPFNTPYFQPFLFSGFDNLKAVSFTLVDKRFSIDKIDVTASSAEKLSCTGFDSPMNKNVAVKKNRALPYKAVLIDKDSAEVTGLNLDTPPVISVKYSSSASPEGSVEVDTLSPGQSYDGNQFEYADGKWQFNLSTANYTASGNYFVEIASGDSSEYIIEPACIGTFTVK